MPLHLYIKPNERFIVGDAIIVNGPRSTTLSLLSRTPVLREKDIIRESEALSPREELQFIMQCILLSEGSDMDARMRFETFLPAVAAQFPEFGSQLAAILDHYRSERYYRALQGLRTLTQTDIASR